MEKNEISAPESTDAPQDGDVLDLSAFIADVIENPPAQQPTEPTFFKEESDTLSEDDMLELDNVITELETSVQQKDEELANATNQLTQVNEEMTAIQNLLTEKEASISDSISKIEKMDEIWQSVINHPEIGKLVEKVAN